MEGSSVPLKPQLRFRKVELVKRIGLGTSFEFFFPKAAKFQFAFCYCVFIYFVLVYTFIVEIAVLIWSPLSVPILPHPHTSGSPLLYSPAFLYQPWESQDKEGVYCGGNSHKASFFFLVPLHSGSSALKLIDSWRREHNDGSLEGGGPRGVREEVGPAWGKAQGQRNYSLDKPNTL